MARFITFTVCLLVVVCVAAAQNFFGGYGGQPEFVRDPRSNRGPVTFPVTSGGSETSGVRVGASGYGFVPPGTRGGIGPHGAGPSFYPGFAFW